MAYKGNSSKIVSSSFLYSTLQTFYTKIKGLLDGKANTSHTHNYAGSSSAGGVATNADKLDGYHASSFCKSESASSTNMNELITSGVYRINSGNTNAPSGADWGQILVIHGGGDTIAQLIFDYRQGRCWIRTGNSSDVGGSGTWTAWRQMYTSENITYSTSALTPGSSALTTGYIYLQYE